MHTNHAENFVDKMYDRYNWQARALPGFIVVMPVALAILAWVPHIDKAAEPLTALIVGTGVGTALLTRIVRDMGKRAEQSLIDEWGALPSVIMLRHSDTAIDTVTKDRYHRALGKLVPHVKMPSVAAERDDPKAADDIYRGCCTYLMSKTRDQKKFDLLFIENIHYGFWRNLYGSRGLGAVLAAFGSVGCLAKVIYDLHKHTSVAPLAVLCCLICLILAVLLTAYVSKQVVRQAGDGYARRLLEAADVLTKDKETTRAAK